MSDEAYFVSVELIVFDFDGVFTDNTVLISHEGVETVRCWRSDGLGLSRLMRTGIKIYIISTETNAVVSVRAKKLGLPCIQAVEQKAQAVTKLCEDLGVPLNKTMFVGNDINDIPAFKIVGAPVAVADAYPEVFPYVSYRTHKAGGYGAVREVCDLVYFAKQSARDGNLEKNS